MKVLSIQSYNQKSKADSRPKKNNSVVFFKGFSANMSTDSDRLFLHFDLLKTTLESRFINIPDSSRIARLTKLEKDILHSIYEFCHETISTQETLIKDGIKIKEINPRGIINGKIESGPMFEIKDAAKLAEKMPGGTYECTLYTISNGSVEGYNDTYSILFDGHGIPKIIAKLDEDKHIVKTITTRI